MKRTAGKIFLAILAACLISCTFENDMSYPVIVAEFTSFDVEGDKSVTIDQQNRKIEIVLDEIADLDAVKVTEWSITEGAEIEGGIPTVLDLTKPKTFVLKTYQDYEWTISAVQPVERYINVANQASEPEFNLSEKIAIVYVTDNQRLQEVRFDSMKLEREGARIISTTGYLNVNGESIEETLDVSFPMTLNCVLLRYFDLEYRGQTIRWTVKVVQETVDMKISSVNAWANKAQVRGLFDGAEVPIIQYRMASESEWISVENAQVAGIGISADITGLQSGTDYQVRIARDGEYSTVTDFRTEEELQLYNFSFDNWWLDGKIWYPYLQGASSDQKVWDSANKGAATFIGSSTTPDETFAVSGSSARMESKYAVIAFAAGNLYTGRFDKIAGVGAELDWGTPFESRPKVLKGYYSYTPQPINRVKAPYESMQGQMDKCQILVLLTDWDQPFRINTTEGKFVDVAADPHIIAHAVLESDRATDGFEEFTLELEYRDLERKPKYAVIACCASYLGDYFTGGEGSLMFVDEFEFVY